jgi:hypothetical protein
MTRFFWHDQGLTLAVAATGMESVTGVRHE